ncbi:MAG TPA: prolipoprotein diacylglyceryl transferase [Micromonosporaceae bacterium]|nr:prolipoprotein diacylglyceryl transferase [Micromonosporaceae bacterium]
MTLASPTPQAAIPSPTTAVWELGPIPIRAYALCIVLGIVVAVLVTEYRLRRRGAPNWAVLDIATFAVPAGIIGARIYHVLTSWQDYFGPGGEPLKALRIWEGGLGIWGAVAGGALGAWLAARQIGLPLTMVADALAPGLPLAQAIGRFGNWFNNELYGGPTTLPWGMKVYQMANGRAVRDAEGNPKLAEDTLVHPTFAYEALWNIGVAGLVLLADRRFKFGRGRAFALYVMGYTAGRFWIEMMRTDEANHILGVRLNVWTAALVFAGALLYFLLVRGPQEYVVPVAGAPASADGAPKGDVSQVNLTARSDRSAATPTAYRVVNEAEYREYHRTGEISGGESDEASARPAGDDR